jgi:hypothetical protein
VRPPLGGWPKSLRLEDGVTYEKWSGAIYLIPWYRTDGMLYLTDRRLIFLPAFWFPGRPARSFSFQEIEELRDDKRPWLPFLLFQLDLWFLRPWYLRARGEEHYFRTTRPEDWLAALSEATGVEPKLRDA